MTEGDRCPRKHLSHRLGPPTSPDSAHRYGWPPSSMWGVMGRGLLDFRAAPMGVQGGALWVGFVWGHSPTTEPAPMRWSFGGGSGDWKRVSEWHLGDQRASPACRQPCWPSKEEGQNAGAMPTVPGGPNRQDHQDPPPPKQGGWSVLRAPSTSSQGVQGVFLLTLRRSRVSLAQERPRELESLSEHQPPPGKGLPGPAPLEERAMSLKAKMSRPQGRPQYPTFPPGSPRPGPGSVTPGASPLPCTSSTPPAQRKGSSSGLLGLCCSPLRPFPTLLGVGSIFQDGNTAPVLDGTGMGMEHKKGRQEHDSWCQGAVRTQC